MDAGVNAQRGAGDGGDTAHSDRLGARSTGAPGGRSVARLAGVSGGDGGLAGRGARLKNAAAAPYSKTNR